MISRLNHVALLVESIEDVVKSNTFSEEEINPIEEFPSEGTRELYVGTGQKLGKLLLMQAIGEGPYLQALQKRGPGLHHIAIDVEKIDDFVESLSGTGWYLHPRSLMYYNHRRQVYLCRHNTPFIVEVQESKGASSENYFIDNVKVTVPDPRMLEGLKCEQLTLGEEVGIFINGKAVNFPH